MEKLYEAGDAILAEAAKLDIPLEDDGWTEGALTGKGWTIDASGEKGLYASRHEESVQASAHIAVRGFACPPLHLLCLVREFDVGKLAGTLQEFHVTDVRPEHTRVEYVSVLPWPFEPRWLLADMEFGVDRRTGALLVLGRSVPGAKVPEGKAHVTLGTVHYSFYQIVEGNPGNCVMRRVINVDMHITLPGFVVRKSLSAHYIADMVLVDDELKAWEGSELQKRLTGSQMYALFNEASEAAATAAVAANKD